MAPKCQEMNAKDLTMVAIGMNKAAEEFLILDERTREELANGKYRDQRLGSFGPPASAVRPRPESGNARPAAAGHSSPRLRQGHAPAAARPPWTRKQEKLALLNNQQGLKPAEIAAKLGVTSRLVTQIILAAKNKGKA